VIAFCRPALAHLPAGTSAGQVRRFLALAISTRCSRFGSADLQGEIGEAIALLMNSDLAAGKLRDRPVLLSMLSGAYGIRAELTETLADADEAVEVARQAVELADASPGKLMLLQSLVTALQHRHIAHGSAADLDAAIEVARMALSLEDQAAPQRRARALTLLSALLGCRAEDSGDLADVDAAVTADREALELVPLEALPASSVHTWALILRLRYDVYGEAADLEETIQILRDLVAATATPARTRICATVNLTQALLHRSVGDTWAELDEAVQVLRLVLTRSRRLSSGAD
jgi:tetratricopeptide (TPR) repeat protein